MKAIGLLARASAAALIAVVAAAASALAQGGPPFLTDDPGTPGPGHWEINVALLADDRAGARTFETPLVDANYGWGERVQLKFEIPWIVSDPSQGPAASGLGAGNFGVKWRFLDEAESFLSVATYPQFAFRTAASSAQNGLVEPGTSFLLPLIFEKNLGPVSVNVEVGYQWRSGSAGAWSAGVAIGRELSDRVEIAGEIVSESDARLSDSEVSWNLGGRWKLDPHLVLLFSGGTGLRGSAEVPRSRAQGYLGMQFLF